MRDSTVYTQNNRTRYSKIVKPTSEDMSYPTDGAKIKAVLQRDPNASGLFVYSVKDKSIFCRPDCNYLTIPSESSIMVFSTAKEATDKGLRACESCQPDLEVQVAPDVISSTVNAVNASIGLEVPSSSSSVASVTPKIVTTLGHTPLLLSTASGPQLFGHHQHSNSELLADGPPLLVGARYQHHRSVSTTGSPVLGSELESQSWRPRRASIANGHIPAAAAAVEEISRNTRAKREEKHRDGDHLRLVDEACRHIAAAAAAAAAVAVANAPDRDCDSKYRSGSNSAKSQPPKLQRKKRRGGILGFKELAAKAGLSPWHFHRVFRSVTGLTPKAYGEACWNAVTLNPSVPSSVLATATEKPGPIKGSMIRPSSVHSMSVGTQHQHLVATANQVPTTMAPSIHDNHSNNNHIKNRPPPQGMMHQDVFTTGDPAMSTMTTASSSISTSRGSISSSTPMHTTSATPFGSFPSPMGHTPYPGASLMDGSTNSLDDMNLLDTDPRQNSNVPAMLHSYPLSQYVPWVSVDDNVTMALENGGIPATTTADLGYSGLFASTPAVTTPGPLSQLFTTTSMDPFPASVPATESNLDPYQFMTESSWMSGTPIATQDYEMKQDLTMDALASGFREWVDTTSS